MTESVKFGIAGLPVPQGTHLCGFYWGIDERDEMVFAFLREGLRSGDKCLYATDAIDRPAIQTELNCGADVPSTHQQLNIVSSSDVYLGRGDFSVPEMLGYWDGWAATSRDDGFSSARAVGEMTWAVTEIIGAANIIRYETELNGFVPRYPLVLLCVYELDKFRGDLLVDIMKTHPRVLMGCTVLENLYYVSHDELVNSRP